MDFENTFRVPAPVDEVYEALLDLERVAPAMPGAQVLEKTGDNSYKVAIKVKVGPMSMTYRGDVTIVDTDPATHSATLDVKAKEARGQGAATAKVVLSLQEEDGATVGTVKAHVQLSGKAASIGRGVIEDVSKQLVQTFADNLAGILETRPAEAEEAAAEPATAAAGQGGPEGAAAAPKALPPPGPKAAPAPAEHEGLPVLPLVASMVADRMRDPKVLVGALGGAALLGYLVGRRSR